jgi:hypothetical protein
VIRQFDLFSPPVIQRAASIATGVVFMHAGRALRVHRVTGKDAAAPVIVEELGTFGTTLAGQYALWSKDAVSRCLSKGMP